MRSSILPALVAPLAAAAAVEPRALAAPRLASFELQGRGCPADGGSTISGSAASVTLTLPDFVSEFRGTERRDFSNNCLATLRLEEGVPGYRLAIRRVYGEGMFFGTPDVRLRVQSVAYFQGYQTLSAVNTAHFNASSSTSTLMPVSFDFGFEEPKQVFSPCVADDGYVGNAYVNMRAIVNWPEGNATSSGAFLGTEANPVTEHIEFEWVACGDIDEPTEEELADGAGGGVVIGDGDEEEVVDGGILIGDGGQADLIVIGDGAEEVGVGGEREDRIVIGDGEPVVIGGEEGEAVVIGGDQEEEEEVVADDGEE